jgi:hypothetical protein
MPAALAEQGCHFDVSSEWGGTAWAAATFNLKEKNMSRKILSLAGFHLFRKEGATLASDTANRAAAVGGGASEPDDGTVPVEDVRAVATEGALATAVDASPAVLVSLWAHDQRLHPGHDRCPPRRGA